MKHTVAVVIYNETLAIWGIFTTRKKAERALSAWGAMWITEFTIRMYGVDYRSAKDAPRYQSDTVHTMDGDNANPQLASGGGNLSASG